MQNLASTVVKVIEKQVEIFFVVLLQHLLVYLHIVLSVYLKFDLKLLGLLIVLVILVVLTWRVFRLFKNVIRIMIHKVSKSRVPVYTVPRVGSCLPDVLDRHLIILLADMVHLRPLLLSAD